MASTHGAGHDEVIRNPGKYDNGTAVTTCLVLAAVGFAVFIAGLFLDPTRAWASFVLNHFYFMSLGIGGIFFVAIQWLTGAMWSAPLRRIMEAISSYLPFSILTMLVLLGGIKYLYLWDNPAQVQGDLALMAKAGYLSTAWFVGRQVAALGVLVFFTFKFLRTSIAQDSGGGDNRYTLWNRRIAPVFLILLGLLFTMMSWDQMMSLDPHWYSTMFGVYCFAGAFYSVLALITLVTLHLWDQGKLKGIVNDNHFHDMGKWMFAFTIFWAYIGFCQFMLIWYANIPEESHYFIARMHADWFWISCFLVFGKFFAVFFVLLPRDVKRNHAVLKAVAWFMLIAQWIDIMWLVQPTFYTEGPVFGWIEIGTTAGFIGVFGYFVFRFLSANNVVAIGDPRLAESVFHHHQ